MYVLSVNRALFRFREIPLATTVVDFVCARFITGVTRRSTIMQVVVFAAARHSRLTSETRIVAPVTEALVAE